MRWRKRRRVRRLYVVFLFAATIGGTPSAQGSTAGKILDAISNARVERAGRVERLYGVVINGPDTAHGRWACARVVAIILDRAGVKVSKRLVAVRAVETALGSWTRIASYEDVRPGDVVVYRLGSNRRGACTGHGTCHVALAVSRSRVYGNVGRDIPPFIKKGPTTHLMVWMRAAGFRFKAAYRPPD